MSSDSGEREERLHRGSENIPLLLDPADGTEPENPLTDFCSSTGPFFYPIPP